MVDKRSQEPGPKG